MGYESIAYEVEGRMGYEGERNNYCFSKIQLVGKKNINPFYGQKINYKYGGRFSLLVG